MISKIKALFQSSRTVYIVPAIIVVLILAGSLVASLLDKTVAVTAGMGRTTVISEEELAEKYGLKVSFIGVAPMMIGIGDVIDLQFEILDFEKAMVLLGDPSSEPKLLLTAPNSMPMAPEKVVRSSMMFELMYPNMGNLVQPGDDIRILFGDIQLEPIKSR